MKINSTRPLLKYQ